MVLSDEPPLPGPNGKADTIMAGGLSRTKPRSSSREMIWIDSRSANSGHREASTSGVGLAMNEAERLRELAGWYRELAERTGNTAIWESRLRTAEDFEAEAERLEQQKQQRRLSVPMPAGSAL